MTELPVRISNVARGSGLFQPEVSFEHSGVCPLEAFLGLSRVGFSEVLPGSNGNNLAEILQTGIAV